jgi:hypothetical protein
VTWARALGAAGDPVESIVSLVFAVQFARFPVVNSSEKIGGAAYAAGATITCNAPAIRATSPRIAIACRALRCRRALMSISLMSHR